MDPVNTLISLAGVAWLGQIALGWVQIRRFNQALADMADNGHISIGRSAGRFKPRVIVVLSLDDDRRVTGNFLMKGLTVFSRPQSEGALTGKLVSEIRPEIMFPRNKSAQQALALAISNKR
ncbi:transcriptional regulator GutM [Pantoea coffeiphila]|uniref:Transcriptional regulator GutM n=1 Tax=Pantoea coffeiphila TaxID=1465635 RepID=A0A2S9IED7_9GAMM|nr:transcriptional regulator GutM [Pantoea coffeiphila]PRD16104.1 transcriptional regulator GutM [Pantoea coffeiphila]